MNPDDNEVKPEAGEAKTAAEPPGSPKNFWDSFLKKAATTGRLAGKEAQRRKLQSIDLRKADHAIGEKAFEQNEVPPEYRESASKLKELREQMAALRRTEAPASDSFGDKAKAAASAAARKARIEALKLKESSLLSELGAKLRTRSEAIPSLASEIDGAKAIDARIKSVETEIEKLRADSWVKRPLLFGSIALVLVAAFFGIRSMRNRHDVSPASDSIAVEMDRYQKDQKEAAAQAERNRQAQLDSVKQLTAMTEKSQRDYQEKQKREQEERESAEREKTNVEVKQKEEITRQASEQQGSAEAKQRAFEVEFLKNRPKISATPNNSGPSTPAGAVKVALNSIPLGPLPKTQSEMESRVAMTSDGTRILVVASQGSREQAIVDGQPGPTCRHIRWTSRDRSDSEPKASASRPFSPDNQRVAYIMEMDGGKESAVIDSAQSPIYERVLWLAFGPLGHHAVFEAQEKDRGGGEKPHRNGTFVSIVDDGKAGPHYDGVGNVTFSADGQHVAYIGSAQPFKGMLYGHPDFARSEYAVVLDGQEQGKRYNWATQLVLSRDGKHLAFLVGTDSLGTQKAVIDGRETPAYGFAEQLAMSDDGSRIAFVTRATPKQDTILRLIDNGQAGSEYGHISDLVISVHGERLAYIAQNKEGNLHEQFVVDNGKASEPYDRIDNLKVSKDGSVLGFTAKSSRGSLVVVNGREFGPFYRIDNNLTYSEDGKHWACSVEVTDSSESGQFLIDGESRPVPNGARYGGTFGFEFRPGKGGWFAIAGNCELEIAKATKDTQVPGRIVYSRDGQHTAKVFPNEQSSTHSTEQVTLNDQPVGPVCHRAFYLQLSDDGKHYAFVASPHDRPGGKVVFDGEEGDDYGEIDDLALSPDGKHFAYAARERSKKGEDSWFLIVDGFKGPAFQQVLAPEYRRVRRTFFKDDGSLTFIAAAKGQLGRYIYPAASLEFMPTLGQAGDFTAGLRVLEKIGGDVQKDLVLGPNETLYGVSGGGGQYRNGTIFSCKTDGSAPALLYQFYGGDDGGRPKSLIMGRDGNLYGFVETGLFQFDLSTKKYSIVSNGESPYGLGGVLPDGALIGQENWTGEWWMIYPSGGGLIPLQGGSQYKGSRRIAAVGPDGAIYSTSEDSLFRQSSAYSPPTLLHKFADSPEEGNDLGRIVTFDPTGTLYGFAKGRGMGSMIYRINRDGSDFRVLVKQAEGIKVSNLVAGDDGMLYGCYTADAKTADTITAGFFSLPASGGTPNLIPKISGGTDHALIYHKRAIYYSTDASVIRVQFPSASGAAQQTPQITVSNISPPPLQHVEPVKFSTFSGQITTKSPDTNTTWLVAPPSGPVVSGPKFVGPGKSVAHAKGTTSEGAGADQATMASFAEKTVTGMSSGEIDSLVSLYGERVDYLDKGAISADAVRNEFQQYFDKWPQTSWSIAGQVNVQSMEDSRYKLTFPVAFEATNPVTGKRVSGNARETMVVAQDGTGSWKIVYQREHIIQSGKTQTRTAGKPVRGERYDPDSERARENAEEIARRIRSLFPH